MALTAEGSGPPALPDFAAVEAAAERLRGIAVRTPLLNSAALDAEVGGRILLKAETLQRTGSFKFRGAYNKLSQLEASARKGGVVAYSSGNHAQGVAQAAQLLGIPAVIVMPADAPEMKVVNTRSYGAEVQLYDRYFDNREEVASALVAERGATLVKPYDDAEIIAGQGTCGLEIVEDCTVRGERLDAVLACCSGGGLSAGIALALRARVPDCEIYSVEPEDFDDHRRSLAAGERVANDTGGHSFCDALLAPIPGEVTFAINGRLLNGGLSVSDAEVADAMRYAYRTLKLVVEPGGAVCLAAILAGKLPVAGRTVAITLSGGNVDPATFADVLTA